MSSKGKHKCIAYLNNSDTYKCDKNAVIPKGPFKSTKDDLELQLYYFKYKNQKITLPSFLAKRAPFYCEEHWEKVYKNELVIIDTKTDKNVRFIGYPRINDNDEDESYLDYGEDICSLALLRGKLKDEAAKLELNKKSGSSPRPVGSPKMPGSPRAPYIETIGGTPRMSKTPETSKAPKSPRAPSVRSPVLLRSRSPKIGTTPVSTPVTKRKEEEYSESESESDIGSDSDSQSGSDSEREEFDVPKQRKYKHTPKDELPKSRKTRVPRVLPTEPREEDTPAYDLNKNNVEFLYIIDTENDLKKVKLNLRKFAGYIRTIPENIPANKKAYSFNVEESVVTKFSKILARYMFNQIRIELVLYYLFDYETRDLALPYQYFGFKGENSEEEIGWDILKNVDSGIHPPRDWSRFPTLFVKIDPNIDPKKAEILEKLKIVLPKILNEREEEEEGGALKVRTGGKVSTFTNDCEDTAILENTINLPYLLSTIYMLFNISEIRDAVKTYEEQNAPEFKGYFTSFYNKLKNANENNFKSSIASTPAGVPMPRYGAAAAAPPPKEPEEPEELRVIQDYIDLEINKLKNDFDDVVYTNKLKSGLELIISSLKKIFDDLENSKNFGKKLDRQEELQKITKGISIINSRFDLTNKKGFVNFINEFVFELIQCINPEIAKNLFAVQSVEKTLCIYGATKETFSKPEINFEIKVNINSSNTLQSYIDKFSGHKLGNVKQCTIDDLVPSSPNETSNKIIINTPEYLFINMNRNLNVKLTGDIQSINFSNSTYIIVGAVGERNGEYYYDTYDFDDIKNDSVFKFRITNSSCSKGENANELLESGSYLIYHKIPGISRIKMIDAFFQRFYSVFHIPDGKNNMLIQGFEPSKDMEEYFEMENSLSSGIIDSVWNDENEQYKNIEKNLRDGGANIGMNLIFIITELFNKYSRLDNVNDKRILIMEVYRYFVAVKNNFSVNTGGRKKGLPDETSILIEYLTGTKTLDELRRVFKDLKTSLNGENLSYCPPIDLDIAICAVGFDDNDYYTKLFENTKVKATLELSTDKYSIISKLPSGSKQAIFENFIHKLNTDKPNSMNIKEVIKSEQNRNKFAIAIYAILNKDKLEIKDDKIFKDVNDNYNKDDNDFKNNILKKYATPSNGEKNVKFLINSNYIDDLGIKREVKYEYKDVPAVARPPPGAPPPAAGAPAPGAKFEIKNFDLTLNNSNLLAAFENLKNKIKDDIDNYSKNEGSDDIDEFKAVFEAIRIVNAFINTSSAAATAAAAIRNAYNGAIDTVVDNVATALARALSVDGADKADDVKAVLKNVDASYREFKDLGLNDEQIAALKTALITACNVRGEIYNAVNALFARRAAAGYDEKKVALLFALQCVNVNFTVVFGGVPTDNLNTIDKLENFSDGLRKLSIKLAISKRCKNPEADVNNIVQYNSDVFILAKLHKFYGLLQSNPDVAGRYGAASTALPALGTIAATVTAYKEAVKNLLTTNTETVIEVYRVLGNRPADAAVAAAADIKTAIKTAQKEYDIVKEKIYYPAFATLNAFIDEYRNS